MAVTLRNENITQMMQGFLEKAKTGAFKPVAALSQDIDAIFACNTKGFREIILVITLAKIIDSAYQPSKEFYKCNPRALYEGPIRAILISNSIPHMKSGPLNVAKAAVGINEQWAAQRRPADIAGKVVKVVKFIESLQAGKELQNFAIYLHAKFLAEAKRVEGLQTVIDDSSSPEFIISACTALIELAPDLGNTPQRIIGYLLEATYAAQAAKITVEGHTDRASVTNTTSKKPGDIIEYVGSKIVRVYEVTVKPFNKQRLHESYEAISDFSRNYKEGIGEVSVICRVEDSAEFTKATDKNGVFLGAFSYQGLRYVFLDINAWVAFYIANLPPVGRISFMGKLNAYITEPNTSEKVKKSWRAIIDGLKKNIED